MIEPGRMFPVPSDWPFETWEVAVTPLPLWLPVEGRRARAWLAVCCNSETDKILASEPGAEEEIPQLLEQVLTRAGQRWRTQPAQVRVADAEVARILEGLLEEQDVEVEVLPRLAQLPEVVDALVAGMAPPDPRPGPLTGEGVTVKRLRSFARAAADLHASSCWRYLSSEDLIQVEAPETPETPETPEGNEGLRCFILTSQPSGPTGLWFLSAADDLETLMNGAVERLTGRGLWTLGFDLPWTAPPEDVDLWERHGLPWAGGDRCPVAYRTGLEIVERPDARQLAFFEGLLATLAATSEEDLDAGRWEKQVETSEGPVRFVLSLPGVLAPGEGEDPDLDTPEERARDLVDQAYDARGRRAVLLARRALEVWPDCADAYSLLADQASEPRTVLSLYAQALAAAERAMGPRIFGEEAGNFWLIFETRPYMRARLGYAETLVRLGRLEEAVKHFQEMLRLNPGDNLGVREVLVNVLISLDQDEEARALLDRYSEDESALMAFPRALLRFRHEGDSTEARKRLKQALRANRFVPGLLLRTRRLPSPKSFYTPGTEEEAAVCLALSRGNWERTPGALDWLREQTVATIRSKSRTKAREKNRKNKRR